MSTTATEPVDLQAAVAAAKEFFLGLEKDKLIPGPVLNVVLEEIAKTPSGDWRITLGYRLPTPLDGAVAAAFSGLRPPRSEFFKVFTVDANTGKVIGMSIREPGRD